MPLRQSAGPVPRAERYRLIDRERWVLSPRWGDECLAYDRAIADTHVISPLARELTEVLQRASGPMSVCELAHELAGALDESDAGGLDVSIEATLLEFVRLGLAERTNP
ncbi:MAG: hypothetical protein OHK0026_08120 [Rhodocyclaceae bacterium]